MNVDLYTTTLHDLSIITDDIEFTQSLWFILITVYNLYSVMGSTAILIKLWYIAAKGRTVSNVFPLLVQTRNHFKIIMCRQ